MWFQTYFKESDTSKNIYKNEEQNVGMRKRAHLEGPQTDKVFLKAWEGQDTIAVGGIVQQLVYTVCQTVLTWEIFLEALNMLFQTFLLN